MYLDSFLAFEMYLIWAGTDSAEVQYQIKASFFTRGLTLKMECSSFNKMWDADL